MSPSIRLAEMSDQPAIIDLIAQSVRFLAKQNYTYEQIEAALQQAWGLDSQLIIDKTYYMVENAGQIVACGGWSFRKTLFGNNAEAKRDGALLDCKQDSAKIRAFFVAPDCARQGIGSLLMTHCETAAISYGFTRLELMSNLTGQPLYQKHGFLSGAPIQYQLGEQLFIEFVPMHKILQS